MQTFGVNFHVICIMPQTFRHKKDMFLFFKNKYYANIRIIQHPDSEFIQIMELQIMS